MAQQAQVHNVGSIGITPDLPAYELPPEAWNLGADVVANNGYMAKANGHSAVFGVPPIAPYVVDYIPVAAASYWLVAGLTAIHATNGTTYADITRLVGGAYSAGAEGKWVGGMLHGIGVWTNGSDVPQAWIAPGLGTPLVDLPNWPATLGCKTIRPFKNFLIAMNITDAGTAYPYNVRWSASAEPGAVPGSWDIADTTNDAGENPLSAHGGEVLDGLELQDFFILYRENSTHAMSYVGGQYVFNFIDLFGDLGILAPNCVTEVQGQHIVITRDDVVAHDTRQYRSILSGRARKWLRDNLDYSNAERAFITKQEVHNEVWICIPVNGGSGYAEMAIVWNWVDNTIVFRSLPSVSSVGRGVYAPVLAETFDSASGTFDEATTTFNARSYDPSANRLIAASPTNSKIYLLDESQTFDGVAMTSWVERTGIPIAGVDRMGEMKIDPAVHKVVREVWPRLQASPGTIFEIFVGSQITSESSITWEGPFTFDPQTQNKIDCMVSGALLGIRIRTTTACDWKLFGYGLTIAAGGRSFAL